MENLTQQVASDVTGAIDNATGELTTLVAEYAFSVVGAILILIFGWIFAKVLERWTRSGLSAFKHMDATLTRFLSKTVRYIVLAFVITTVLSQFGVQTTSIIAALGAAGLAIGLALQGTLQNVAAGIMLLVLRPLKVGELIEAGGVMAIVEEIGLFTTEMKRLDGLYMMVPNSEIWNKPITNYHRNSQRRGDLNIGIGYGDSADTAIAIMRGIVERDDRVLSDPEPYYYVQSLGDSAVAVEARYWTLTKDYWNTLNDLRKLVKERFDAEGISIPFPQRDLHIVSGQTDPSQPQNAIVDKAASES
ncbi:mechanosensitive ion channel family protein [Notoacmeibacter sp. MSK16QG-6]|uniref:mechanosensitive ion channel family protein n=1 Tax=Notoacmeibacter sp. MSK16QG-6 TaxID=2957982 RepID=UPI00209EA4FF|nr:mechanosensitive ion channel domain-containing protein [Notoacmeibacter sp. MSK16QG-6]MCP1198027.1 mechanosensitive ion channel [Notoacmeibacter sp. MSK16QG-6]